MAGDDLSLSLNTNQATNMLKHDELAQEVINKIFKKISDSPDKKNVYDEALKILARRKYCVKKSLEILYQAQATQSHITETVKTLEKCYADLCNGIDHDTIYLIGLINEVLNALVTYYGASFEQTIPIRNDLDQCESQKPILVVTVANTIALFNYFKQLFEINLTSAIAAYSTQHVDSICHSNIPLISFLMARSIDKLKLRIEKNTAWKILNEIPYIGAKEMFQYIFSNSDHAGQFYSEFIDVVKSLNDPSYCNYYNITTYAATYHPMPEQHPHDAADVSERKQSIAPIITTASDAPFNTTETATQQDTIATPCNKKSYADAIKTRLPEKSLTFLKLQVQSFSDNLKPSTAGYRNEKRNTSTPASQLKRSNSLASFQHTDKNSSNKRVSNFFKFFKRADKAMTRTQSMYGIAGYSRGQQTAEKSRPTNTFKLLRRIKSPFLAFSKMVAQDDEESIEEKPPAETSLAAITENKKGEKIAQKRKQDKIRKKNSVKQKTAQEKADAKILAEFAKKTAEEKSRQQMEESHDTIKHTRSIEKLLAESKSLLEKYYGKEKIESRGRNSLSVHVMAIKSIAPFLNGAAELVEELTLLLEKEPDKKKKKKAIDEKQELTNLCEIVQEKIIPSSVKSFTNKIIKQGINASKRTFIDLINLIDAIDTVGISERYEEQFRSSGMNEFLTILTKLTKEYFFESSEPLNGGSQIKVMESIKEMATHLAAILKIKEALDNIMAPEEKEGEVLGSIETAERYLEAIKLSENKNETSLLEKLIDASSYKKIFYTILQQKRFKLAGLLVLAGDFKATENDLYIAYFNSAWDVVYLLLEKGVNPFSLYKNGDMPFKNIIASDENKSIVFSIKLIEKYYDDLNKSNKLPTVIDLLRILLSKKSKFDFEIRDAVKSLFLKNPKIKEVPSKMGIKMNEDIVFIPLLHEVEAEKKLYKHFNGNNLSSRHPSSLDSSLIDKLYTLKEREICAIGLQRKVFIFVALVIHAQYAIENQFVTLKGLKATIRNIINNICNNINIVNTAKLIRDNCLLQPNMYISLIHLLAEYAFSFDDGNIYNLLCRIVTSLPTYKHGEETYQLVRYIDKQKNETPLHIALRHGNYKAAAMLIVNDSNLMATDAQGVTAAHLFFHPDYRNLQLFNALYDFENDILLKILNNDYGSLAQDADIAHKEIMALVELENTEGYTLTEFLALYQKENFVITLLEHGSCAFAEKIHSLYKIAQRLECRKIITYLEDHSKVSGKMASPPTSKSNRFYQPQKPHPSSLEVDKQQYAVSNAKSV